MAVIGAGRAGGALALSLSAAGWSCGLVGRPGASPHRAAGLGLPWLGVSDAPAAWLAGQDVVVLAVRDADLPALAATLAAAGGMTWQGRVALHLSGSLSSGVLAPLAERGACAASLHPLTSLAAREDASPAPVPPGTPFFGEGEPAALAMARRIAEAVGGSFHELGSADKPLYHAGATLAGNLAAVMHAAGGSALRMAGLPAPERALLPLVRASVDAVASHAGLGGLTGPLTRGDVETLSANIEALRRASPALRRAHAAVSLLGLELLEQAGRRPERCEAMQALLRAVLEEVGPG